MAKLGPIVLIYGSVTAQLEIPDDFILYEIYFQLKQEFHTAISRVEPPSPANKPQPSSPAELMAKFLGFAAFLMDVKIGEQYPSVVKHTLNEFHRNYLRGQDINGLAYSLMRGDVNSAANKNVKENIVRNYYIAVVKCNYRIVPDSSYFNGTFIRKLAVCFGQGNINYFPLLVDLIRFYGALVPADFLRSVCFTELERDEDVGSVFSQGLDFLSWLDNPSKRPDIDYLMSAPVSCPLIAVTQLVHYCIVCKLLGFTPGEYNWYALGGATGHGQGIITALAISESDSWESYFQNARKAVRVMLSIGAYVGLQDFGAGFILRRMRYDCVRKDEAIPSPMLLIRGLTLHQVESFVTQVNKDFRESQHIAISMLNGPTNFAVSGPIESLYHLNISLRKSRTAEGSSRFSHNFLTINAPFNSHVLKDTYPLIIIDLEEENMNTEYYSNNLRIPVYDTHNGTNLQEYNRAPQDYSLTTRVIKLITELPVHWETAARYSSPAVLEIGQEDVFGLFR